ncbi:lysine--tRNA ligase, partial [Candidatus Woesearchaeota archaeon]|nr:lysine--tRNA ligase [Candidatus Woesearchaeota archaeon]
MATEDRLIQERVNKLKEIREMGIEPYPYSFPRANFIGRLLVEYNELAAEEKKPDVKVAIAGRIMLKREMGKASFADVMDES